MLALETSSIYDQLGNYNCREVPILFELEGGL
jgi:hypothetical protein